MLASTAVHTTGINWGSVVTIVGSIVVIMTAVFGLLAKYISARISGAINQFRLDVLSKMEERLSLLEQKLGDNSNDIPGRPRRYPR